MNVDISRALQIEGWMTPLELEWLAQQARSHSHIVELGSFCGRSTRVLAEHTSGIVTAIDTWGANPLHPWDMEIAGESLHDVFCRNMAGVSDRVQIIKGDHADLSVLPEIWEADKPDMVFIDGDHTYTGFRRDLLNYMPKVKPGGLLCGHDARNDDLANGTMEMSVGHVLDDYLPGWNLVPDTHLWWIEAPMPEGFVSLPEQRAHAMGGEAGVPEFVARRVS